ncbi:MAG: Large extracellular alpha-helical protein, partial [Armatimonadetes bacterium]|nr:Large extracellular alpha-helical protein [Armatimonadota bacterium]
PMLEEFQQGYFARLSWSVMLLCLVGSTLHIIRRKPAALLASLPLIVGGMWYAQATPDPYWLLAAFLAMLGVFFGVAIARPRIRLGEGLALLGIALILAATIFPMFARAREMARKGPTTSIAPSSAAAGAIDGDVTSVATPPAAGVPQPPRVREYFPETLFWSPEVITDDQGEVEVTVPAADSITTWRLSAVASTAGGLVGSSSVGLRVFQDFFLDLDLPVTLTQHDQITIPVAVHNYLATPQSVEVALKPAEWFRLEGPTSHRVQLAPNSVGVVRFPITALSFGKHVLEVSGTGSRLSDAMRREVEVLPDGEEVEGTESDRLEPVRSARWCRGWMGCSRCPTGEWSRVRR